MPRTVAVTGFSQNPSSNMRAEENTDLWDLPLGKGYLDTVNVDLGLWLSSVKKSILAMGKFNSAELLNESTCNWNPLLEFLDFLKRTMCWFEFNQERWPRLNAVNPWGGNNLSREHQWKEHRQVFCYTHKVNAKSLISIQKQVLSKSISNRQTNLEIIIVFVDPKYLVK